MIARALTTAFFFLAGGAPGCADPLPDRPAAAPVALELHISARETSITQGEPPPRITATITNRGKVPVTLVLPGDGSDSGWRTPLVGFSCIKLVDGKPRHPTAVPITHLSRCGNINALKRAEVFTLAPGQRKDLSEWIGTPRLAEPGEYSVVFYYANEPARKWQGLPLGQHDPGAMEQAKGSQPCQLVSNELRFTVRKKE